MNIEALSEDILNSLDRKKKVKPRTKFVKAGKGRKYCPECENYIGVRTQVCDCGHKFEKGVTEHREQAVEPPVSDQDRIYAMAIGAPGGRLVYAGAGSPAVSLIEITPEVVSDYCNFVVHEGITKGLIYTVEAIKKFIQHEFGYNSEEYRQACIMVDKWYEYKVIGISLPQEYEEEVI